ncbi:hypothetical protein MJH12_15475 [bacterium]|nr:hypothetical protein [bacterium]
MKHVFTIPISTRFLSKRLEVLTAEHSKHLSFEIKDGLWFGKLQVLNDGKLYEIDFELFEVCIEMIESRLLLNATFARIPDVHVKGDFFEELGSSLINLISKAVTIEQALNLSKLQVEGLVAVDNEASYELQKGRVPGFVEWIFSKGFVFLVEPSIDGLLFKFNYKSQN